RESTMKQPACVPVLAALAAIALPACSGAATTTTGPSPAPIVTATMVESAAAAPQPPTFTGHLCATPTVQLTPFFFIGGRPFDIVVVPSQQVDMMRLTLALIDGSHVGGPTITFPQAELNAQFGSTIVLPGTRTFTVQPAFTCATAPITRIGATMWLIDR